MLTKHITNTKFQPSFVAYKLDLDVPTQFPSPTVENVSLLKTIFHFIA